MLLMKNRPEKTVRKKYYKSNMKSRREFIKMGAMAGSLAFLPGLMSCRNRSKSKTPESILSAKGIQEPLSEMGLLDITKTPYSADPKGETDSTKAIQQAVNDARDNGLVCFFPEGTYLISDTISCEQKVEKLDKPLNQMGGTEHYWPYNQTPIVLMGSTRGKRPLIKLAKDAKGFDDPLNPKKAIWIWAQTYYDAPGKDEPVWGQEKGSISFNHIFIGIDIDIRGHAGAIGIRHSGSQGSSLLNSTIYAEGAYSGLSNCCGQGGGTYNIEVIGGEHGIVLDIDSRFPLLTSCTFRDQTKDAIRYIGDSLQVSTVFVGCLFKPNSPTVVDMSQGKTYIGILMIDCMFDMNGGKNIVLTKKKENIFIENSYIKGVDTVCSSGPSVDSARNWILIDRFSSQTDRGVNMINGKETEGDILTFKQVASAPSYKSIHDQHFGLMPSFEDKDAVNVKSFGAKGDGTTNDIEAFRKAIAASDKIFVPKGNFLLTGALELGPNTQIFGLTRSFTSIGSGDFRKRIFTMVDSDILPDPIKHEPFLLTTIDDANASPGLVLLSVKGEIGWKSGKGTWMLAGGRPDFSGNGGGKFYGFGAGRGSQFIMEGIKQPTSFYAINVERVETNPMSEIRNCSNIRIFYFKVEAGALSASYKEKIKNTPCRISDSENISVYCMQGHIVNISNRGPMLEIANSRNIKACQVKGFFPYDFLHIREINGGHTIELPSTKMVSLFVRD
jgi:hypothetical protein